MFPSKSRFENNLSSYRKGTPCHKSSCILRKISIVICDESTWQSSTLPSRARLSGASARRVAPLLRERIVRATEPPTEPQLSCSGSHRQWGSGGEGARMQEQAWWGRQDTRTPGHHQDTRTPGHQDTRQARDGRGARSSRDSYQRRGRVQQHGRWGDLGKREAKQEQQEEKTELGFGDLCRFYHRTMRTEKDDYTSHNVSQGGRDCCYIYLRSPRA